MLDLKIIRENPELVKQGVLRKNSNCDIDQILAIDVKRRGILTKADQLKAERNRVSAEIAKKKKAGETTDADVAAMRHVGDDITALDTELRDIEELLQSTLSWVPNLPHVSVPEGGEAANVIVRNWGEPAPTTFKVLPHWEIGEKLGILDLAGAAKITGSGFYVLKGMGAKLQRALINYMLDLHSADGFTEVNVPHIVNADTMYGTGQLPKLADDMYKTEGDNLYLIPTAEVPVTNLYKQEIINADQLPIRMVAYTPCFRREAGSAGKDTRGMIRVHQFDKVELVKIVRPENSYDELETLVAQAEKILQGLKLPYRVLLLASGDLSFAAAKCYDLELWCAGVEKYLEISSVSNFEDFQSRRMKCRFRDENKEIHHPHTLNGSGVALARLIPAILENYQNGDGTITIPEVLRPYMQGAERIS
ncbi:MAG: serine--tRNA ligase [candidate division Zixibacteria bacterium]|nr:serine--tRNA ligase [candidate division Zixibacteria bacterium]